MLRLCLFLVSFCSFCIAQESKIAVELLCMVAPEKVIRNILPAFSSEDVPYQTALGASIPFYARQFHSPEELYNHLLELHPDVHLITCSSLVTDPNAPANLSIRRHHGDYASFSAKISSSLLDTKAKLQLSLNCKRAPYILSDTTKIRLDHKEFGIFIYPFEKKKGSTSEPKIPPVCQKRQPPRSLPRKSSVRSRRHRSTSNRSVARYKSVHTRLKKQFVLIFVRPTILPS